MRKMFLCSLLIMVLLFNSCNTREILNIYLFPTKLGIKMYKSNYWNWVFYETIYSCQNVDGVKQFLESGFDPNYCKGETGWEENNPIALVISTMNINIYQEYDTENNGREKIDDIKILDLLKQYGADFNKRPYIWQLVYFENSKTFGHFQKYDIPMKLRAEYDTKEFQIYLRDVMRVMKKLLELGADPDKLGHPYPYIMEAFEKRLSEPMTDTLANSYFLHGTRPINEAIKKGMLWESQVDFLLEYVKLDKDSLTAAEASGDSAMIQKIQLLWAQQQKTPF